MSTNAEESGRYSVLATSLVFRFLALYSVDAVLICGAPHVNVNMVRRALRHGKDVLVDRPVSLVPTAVMACHEEAQNTDSILMFAFTRCVTCAHL